MYSLYNLRNKISINKGNIVRERGNLCYIYNTCKKNHLFISKEVLDYIKQAANKGLNIKDFIDLFQSKNDKEYISEVLDKLVQIGYLDGYKIGEKKQNKYFDSVYITLTNRCNLSCIHCASSCSPTEKDILSTEEIFTILKNVSNLNPRGIVFTGGEPLLRKDLETILIQARNLMPNTQFVISTNATLINKENIHLFKLFNKIDISIDGINEETCSEIRGKGVFDKVINNIRFLQDNGFYNISLSMVFGEKTNHLINDFKELNKNLKTTPVIRGFSAIGRGQENYSYFNNEYHSLPISITEIYKTKADSRKISSCACNAFESSLSIDDKGIAYPCFSLVDDSYAITNLAESEITYEEFSNLLNNKKSEFNKILEFKDTKCEDCDLNIFCWNCPSVFENAKNNNEINIWCERIKSNLEEIVWRQI